MTEAGDTGPAAGSAQYYALLREPAAVRAAIAALLALHEYIARIPATCSDASVARIKLAWWREECDRLAAGEPRHPAAKSYAAAMRSHALPATLPGALVNAVDAGLGLPVPAGREVLREAWRRETGLAWRAWAACRGAGADGQAWAEAVGTIAGHCESLRELRMDLAAGRMRLPAEDFAAAGTTLADLVSRPGGEAARRLVAMQLDRIGSGLRQALAAVPAADRGRLAGQRALAAILRATIEEVARDGGAVLQRRIDLTPLRMLWIAWRTR
ncbi:MAG: squalene/phytoene synthase family protein [Gammaproteobacteria bacterium]